MLTFDLQRFDEVIESPIDSYTISLLHFDDASAPFKDEIDGNVWSGNAAHVLNGGMFGKSIIVGNYNGTADRYVNNTSTINLGGKDLTVDFWCKHDATISSGEARVDLFYIKVGSTGLIMCLYYHSVYGLEMWFTDSVHSYVSSEIRESYKNVCGQFNHIAVTYIHSTGVWTLWINGVASNSYTSQISSTASTIRLGGRYRNPTTIPCVIDEFRISNGIARYTSTFNPPTMPYGMYYSISGYLCKIIKNGSLYNTVNVYNSSYTAKSVKVINKGTLGYIDSASSGTLKTPDQSSLLYCNEQRIISTTTVVDDDKITDSEHNITLQVTKGSMSYSPGALTLSNVRLDATTFPFTLGGSDFTIEILYTTPTSVTSSSIFFVNRMGFYASGANGGRWDYWYCDNMTSTAVSYGSGDQISNTKYHLALSYSHTDKKVYIANNGVIKFSPSRTINSFTPSLISIGTNSWHTGVSANGLLHAVRITKGSALYKSSYTVPTALSTNSNVVFILNF